MKPPRLKPTLKELARTMGVSPATISNAYHRPERLSANLRTQILDAADRLGYYPDPTASGLRLRTTGTVGVLYKDALPFAFTDPAFSLFLQGVAQTIQKPGLKLLLLSGAGRDGQDLEAIRGAAIDGVVWYAPARHDPRLAQVIQRHLPTVLVDAEPVPGLPLVAIDDEVGAAALADHLFDLGHRRIALVSMPYALDSAAGPVDLEALEHAEFRAVRSRCTGYAAAAQRRGIPWQGQVTAWATSVNGIEQGRVAGHAILGTAKRPTAIICLSDQLALGVLAATRELRLSVPEDVSIVGFDDVPESARTTPPLTTVHQAHDEKGRVATALLLDQLAGRRTAPRRMLHAELVVRGSCGPPRAERRRGGQP